MPQSKSQKYRTANILPAKNTTFCGLMISHALPVPFGHLITVPSTADKWYLQLVFLEIFFYIVHTVVCTPKDRFCTLFFCHIHSYSHSHIYNDISNVYLLVLSKATG